MRFMILILSLVLSLTGATSAWAEVHPDAEIVYVYNYPDSVNTLLREIRAVNVKTGHDRLIKTISVSAQNIWGISVSPTENTIVFGAKLDGACEIYTIDADGNNMTQVTNDGSGEGNRRPVWLDDEFIVYSTNSHTDGPTELALVRKDGTGKTIIKSDWGTDSSYNYNMGAFSPDRSKIAYDKGLSGENTIAYVADYPTFANEILIGDFAGDLASDNPCSWSVNDRIGISVSSTTGGVGYSVTPSGTEPDTLFENSSGLYGHWPLFSPDGSAIAYYDITSGFENIWLCDSAGDNPIQLTHYTHAQTDAVTPMAWMYYQRSSLLLPSLSTLPCDNECVVQPVMADCSEPMNGAQLCLEVPTGVEICSVSTFGTICDGWAYNYVDYSKWADSGFIFVALADDFDQIPADTSTLFYIHYYMPPLCNQNQYVQWDTAQSHVETRQLVFSDSANQRALPFFDRNQDSTEILGYMPGDCNNDESLDIADLTCMVDKMFKGGEVCVVNAIRVNGDAFLDISDLTYMVAYMFKSGPAPLCPGVAPKVVVDRFVGISLNRSKGKTVINLSSSIDLSGLELTLAGAGNSSANLVNLAGIDLIDGEVNGLTRIGLLDLEGDNVIPSGEFAIIQLDGEFELVDARASDLQHRSLAVNQGAAASGNDPSLPLEFNLSQNYPNPFNPTTEIGFSLPDAGHVTLEIFNIVGQRIEVLVDGTREAGHHVVEWDAGRYASGVYLYRLTAGDFVETRRMVLVK